jgi:hypothetical protein
MAATPANPCRSPTTHSTRPVRRSHLPLPPAPFTSLVAGTHSTFASPAFPICLRARPSHYPTPSCPSPMALGFHAVTLPVSANRLLRPGSSGIRPFTWPQLQPIPAGLPPPIPSVLSVDPTSLYRHPHSPPPSPAPIPPAHPSSPICPPCCPPRAPPASTRMPAPAGPRPCAALLPPPFSLPPPPPPSPAQPPPGTPPTSPAPAPSAAFP